MRGLGQRIRQRREALKLRQQQLADALRVSAQAVSKWEREANDPDIIHLPRLARVLSVSTDWLLGVAEPLSAGERACIALIGVSSGRLRSVELGPAAFAAWCNTIATRTSECVRDQGGEPIKCLGAGVLAWFGGETASRDCARAVLASWSVTEVPLKVGVCEGRVWRGPSGHPDFSQPDVFGDAVSTALALADWVSQEAGHALAWANPDVPEALLRFGAEHRDLSLPDLPRIAVVGTLRAQPSAKG